MKTPGWTLLAIIIVAFAAACSGDDGMADDHPRDGGVDVERDGGAGPDRDRDTVPDDVDNCPDIENHLQQDLDEDGLGDACDTCPAYPNAGEDAPRRQEDCVLIAETEDNGETPQAITLPEGKILEIAGVVEANADGVVDRFTFQVDEFLTFFRVHVRPESSDTLEPVVVIDSEHYTQTREADASGGVLREMACYRPGSYTIAVGDRRARYDGQMRGGDDARYRLVIEPYEPEPTSIEMRGRQAKTVDIDLGGPGRLFFGSLQYDQTPQILEAFETTTRLGRGESQTGIDTVLVAGSAENDNRSPETTDSGLGRPVSVRNGFNVIVDHHRVYGDDDFEVTLTIRPNDPLEHEPNDVFEDAILMDPLIMVVRSNIALPPSVMDGPPDEDWYAVDAHRAGELIQFGVSGSDRTETIATAYADDGGQPRMLFRARQISRTRNSPLNIVAYQTGRYWVRLADAANESPPYVGGRGSMGEDDYRYSVTAGVVDSSIALVSLPVAEPTVEADSTLSAQHRDPGTMTRHPILVRQRSRLVVSTTTTAPEVTPHLSLYGPGLVGLFAEGTSSIDVEVDPAEQPYVLGVRNANDGLPHDVDEPAYTLQLRYLPPN